VELSIAMAVLYESPAVLVVSRVFDDFLGEVLLGHFGFKALQTRNLSSLYPDIC